jgi:peptidoglycan lytic transglycosylase
LKTLVLHRRQLILVLLSILVLPVWCGSFLSAAPPAAAQSSTKKTQSSPKKKVAKKAVTKKRKRTSPRLRRMHRAFVASSSLKAMARQLLQDRTPAAYAGVESYARNHTKEDAGALAWLVVGYAHILDHDYAKAIDPLNRAKPNAGDLGDYVNFYLGSSYLQTGQNAEAVAALAEFDKTYPDSLLIHDEHVVYANALLGAGRAGEAVAVLEKDREPTRAEVELALGRAYAASGEQEKATNILRNLYFTMPLSTEASQADEELKKLTASSPLPAPSLNLRRTRADLLAKGKRFSDAADEYRALVDQVSPPERAELQLTLAVALRRSGQTKEAKKVLDALQSSTPEMNAQRLFNLAEVARADDDDDGFLRILGQLRQEAPTSPWMEQALLSEGNIYLLKRDYDRAIESYGELQQRFPEGSRASYAHWKVAWLSLRQGKNAEAKNAFEQQIALYPASAEVPAALYWRGRLAEEDNDPGMARAYYQKLSGRFQNYYYGELARVRLRQLKPEDDPPHYALLDRVPPIDSNAKVTEEEAPSDNLRAQKAELLENGALVEFAVKELQAAAEEEKGNWLPAAKARFYQDAGRYDMAIETLKRTVPNYFALDLSSLPRTYWEGLFPKPYWTDLKKSSSENALDPYLVASLIRQESAFNPNAVSNKNAVGLMQLLPKVGKGVAKQEKIKHFSPAQLFTPSMNLQLGTRYFRSMVDKFGAFEYALAAYNAGSDRVQDWQGYGKYRDVQEFVESIPFTETREYVQAIMRNANLYRQLYGTP